MVHFLSVLLFELSLVSYYHQRIIVFEKIPSCARVLFVLICYVSQRGFSRICYTCLSPGIKFANANDEDNQFLIANVFSRPHIKNIFQSIAAKVGNEPCCDWVSCKLYIF